MRIFSSVKLRSFLPLTIAAAALAGLAGCNDDGRDHHWDDSGPPADETITDNPKTAAIDTGATLSSPAGSGVGVFVQYTTGGHWTFTSACDTNTSGDPCGFDLFVAGVDPATTLSSPSVLPSTGTNGQGSLQPGDGIRVLPDGTLHFQTITSTSLDGFTLDATPGATLQLEMYLDTIPQPRFVYWIGGKVLHAGAPTDPINFSTSAN